MAFVPAAVVPAATAAPAAETAATCAPVVLLTARGSGESLENGHGPTLTKLVDELHGTTLKDGFDGVSVPAKAIPYPAVPMEQYTGGKDHLDTDLFDSVDYGVIFGASMIDSILEDCKDTRFLLAGYSQGVIVARKLAEARGPDRIAGVIGVGDPAQRGNMPHISGGGKGGDGIYRYMIRDEDGKAASDSFYDAGLKYAMWCHPQDWICNFVDEKDRPEDANNPLFATFDHSYPADPAESIAIAAVMAVMARDAAKAVAARPGAGTTEEPPAASEDDPAGVPGAGSGRAIDVVFAIDTTNSMDPYIDQARATASSISATLLARSQQVRLGVAEYRDEGEDFQARLPLDLTEDLDAFKGALDELNPTAGGDTPESVYSGIMMALRANWDPTALHAVIVLGDAPAKDPEPVTGYTVDTITQAAKDLVRVPELPPTLSGEADVDSSTWQDHPGDDGPRVVPAAMAVPAVAGADDPPVAADVAVFALAADDRLSDSLTPLADATGGTVTDITKDGDLSQTLVDTMDMVATPLVPALASPGVVVAGRPFVLDAGATSAAAGTFTFDANSDGTPDADGVGSAQMVLAGAAGPHTAKVVVTDRFGRTGEATVAYNVLPTTAVHTVAIQATQADTPWVRDAALVASASLLALLLAFILGWLRGRRRTAPAERTEVPAA